MIPTSIIAWRRRRLEALPKARSSGGLKLSCEWSARDGLGLPLQILKVVCPGPMLNMLSRDFEICKCHHQKASTSARSASHTTRLEVSGCAASSIRQSSKGESLPRPLLRSQMYRHSLASSGQDRPYICRRRIDGATAMTCRGSKISQPSAGATQRPQPAQLFCRSPAAVHLRQSDTPDGDCMLLVFHDESSARGTLDVGFTHGYSSRPVRESYPEQCLP